MLQGSPPHLEDAVISKTINFQPEKFSSRLIKTRLRLLKRAPAELGNNAKVYPIVRICFDTDKNFKMPSASWGKVFMAVKLPIFVLAMLIINQLIKMGLSAMFIARL